MNYINLGKSNLRISTISFGAWGISGRDWGTTDDEVSKKAINAALDNGVNLIDTADVYGFGHSEELIAQVLEERGEKNKIIIATKAGNNFYPFISSKHKTTPANPDYSQKHIIFAAEQSLKRLKRDYIDILQLHSPTTDLLKRDEPWLALEKLKKQGKILFAGLSVQSFKESEQAFILDEQKDILDTLQVRYNLLEREAEKKLFPKAIEHNMGVIVRIPLLFGLLSGKFNRLSTFGEDDHRQNNLSSEKLLVYLNQLDKMNTFFSKHSQFSMSQLSLCFCISHPACHAAIPGAKTETQVLENIAASEISTIHHSDFPTLTE
ncbi:MAG: aldo/keto reductase [Ignavibacteriaceae bacterium]|nr:aldo/keto reductase [Ignavibacteriaceae bacterium]